MCVEWHAGRGVSPRVDLDYVEDGLSRRQVGELCDATSQHLIRFVAVNPFTYTQRDITVNNRMCVYTDMRLSVYFLFATGNILGSLCSRQKRNPLKRHSVPVPVVLW